MFDSIIELLWIESPGWGGNLLEGTIRTLEIAVGATIFGFCLGMAGASAKLYGSPGIVRFANYYTVLVRAVPELILILLLYYAGTDMLNRLLALGGYPPVDISGLAAGIGVLGFVQGAYSTEVIRGAILAVPLGQFEAARAFGMPPFTAFRSITLPAMLPHAIPGLANLWLATTKDTALLAVVGFNELALQARQAAGVTKSYLVFYCATGLIYLAITGLSNIVITWTERRVRRGIPNSEVLA